MNNPLPQLEKFIQSIFMKDGTDLVNMEITDFTNTISKVVMKRYAVAMQSVANIIGIKVTITPYGSIDINEDRHGKIS